MANLQEAYFHWQILINLIRVNLLPFKFCLSIYPPPPPPPQQQRVGGLFFFKIVGSKYYPLFIDYCVFSSNFENEK
jgi:hypothetical protein